MTDKHGVTQTGLGNTFLLKEREIKMEDQFVFAVGPTLCTFLNRILKVVSMFNADHTQMNVAATDFVDWMKPQFERFNEEFFPKWSAPKI